MRTIPSLIAAATMFFSVPQRGGSAPASREEAPHVAFYACVSTPREKGVEACRTALSLRLSLERRIAAQSVLAMHLASVERWEDAVAAYRELVRLRPNDGAARLRLGEALLYGLGRAEDALSVIDAALQLEAGSAEAHGSRGFALASLNRFGEAVTAFEQAQRLDPDYWRSRPAARAVFEAARRNEQWPKSQ
jgi:tetratricopeptide (TPR) repeat protein